jgi:hypothetical protein
MSKSKNPTHNMISGHNLPYFNKVIMDTTFYNILRKIKNIINLKILKKIKLMSYKNKIIKNKIIKKKLSKYKYLKRLVRKNVQSFKTLKYDYKAHIRRVGKKKTRYLTGNNLFDDLKFIKF